MRSPPEKRRAPRRRPPNNVAKRLRSTLRELEAATRTGAAVLLALDDAAVAGQEAALLEDATQLGLEVGERLRDAVTDSTGLAGETATGDGDWCEVVAYVHWPALGRDASATLADCAARLLAGVAAHEALAVSGGYAQLAAAGAAPPLLGDPGASLPGLRLELVSNGWDPIGLGAIQDLVQEAYGPVDLDRSTVSLAP